MTLRSALDDYKRHRGSDTRFPGERRTTEGRFSGLDGRLVHVSPDGELRDYSYPLVGLYGIDRSRFGIAVDGDYVWFDDATSSQSYHGRTGLVETIHDFGEYAVTQYDLTLHRTHVTHVEPGPDAPADATPIAFYSFTPEGNDGSVGKLVHDDAIEVYHDREHDYAAAGPDVSEFSTQVPEAFDELVQDDPVDLPRTSQERYEDARLGNNVLVVTDAGSATLATELTDRREQSRTDALERVRRATREYADPDALVAAAEAQADRHLPTGVEGPAAADLRAVTMLTSDSGARIAGPDFDEYFAYSGGYGYTWFRDDGEISRFLLESADALDLDLDGRHANSTAFYQETQSEDGTWPHRVWPHNGALAPGWANSRLEEAAGDEFQADQAGSVAAYLATYLRLCDPTDRVSVIESVRSAVEGLDRTLDTDGLPEPCQNAWENMSGRFAHTAATYLHAYSAVARAPVPADLADHARARADAVYEALDDLWVTDRGVYALRATPDGLDDRLDSSTLALADAHREYAHLQELDQKRLARLDSHVATTLDGLYRAPEGPVEGLVRFEGDPWRTRDQDHEKIWSVSTAWGANAAANLAALFDATGYDAGTDYEERAYELLDLVLPGGPLCMDTGYLPEQVFDDGTPDSATPLGWPHAIRFATLAELDLVETAEEPAARALDD